MSRTRLAQPSEVIACRLARLRAVMTGKGVDAYLVTNRRDQYYLTHFEGEDGAALILANHVYLITDGRFAEQAQISAPWARAIMRKGRLTEAIGKTVRKHRLDKVIFDPAEASMLLVSSLRKACRPSRLVAAAGLLTDMRQIKDSSEVQAIIRAAEVAEKAFSTVTRRIRPGMTERQVAADLLYEMLRLGASDASFPIIVAEGAASSLPHARAGDRKIHVGSAVLIDWGATVDHYRSDLTRVVFVRKIPPCFGRMYANVLAAQAVGIEAIRAGVAFADVDEKARRVLKRRGMDKAFSHGLGHGIGLDIHEAPRLAKQAKGVLQAGMVVTVEPGVYFPGVGGVRIEDDVLVTEDGCRVLTHLPKELEYMVV